MLKCSRCQHVFPGPWAAGKTRRPRSTPPAPAHEVENPSFSFDEDDDWQQPEPPAEGKDDEFALDVEDEPDRPSPVPQPPPAPQPVAPSKDLASSRPATPKVAAEPVALSWDDGAEETAAEEPAGRQPLRISLRPVLILLVLIVISYAVLARTLYANPEWAYGLIRRVPVFGDGLSSQLLNDQVDLIKVEGGYQRTKEGKVFFLISGQALNNAPVPLTQVQVVARLLDRNGTVLQEKPTFCGSSVPIAVLRDLSLQAMEIIPHLKPSDRSVIRPGETSPFVIVFTDVPGAISEFTTEVVAAQRQA